MSSPILDASLLPDSALSVDFLDTSFFRTPNKGSPVPRLPSPTTVLEACQHSMQNVVRFEDMNLVVKLGDPSRVRLEEALALKAVKQAFPGNEVPVPELFGWRVADNVNFIYMSYVPGLTLRDSWPSLTFAEKESICSQLSGIVDNLRRVKQSTPTPFIGSVNGGEVQDKYFRPDLRSGPFPSIKAFNDWVQFVALPRIPIPDRPPEPYRDLLPDTGNIYLTHGDLHRGNIIVSGTPGARKIVAVVDWEQAGWYPEYWEYCKALIAEPYDQEWRAANWVDLAFLSYMDEWEGFGEYWSWRRP